MPKKAEVSAFDEILGTFGSDEDRQVFQSLAEKNPKVLEYGLRQSDYSRRMDEMKERLKFAEEWDGWKSNNWDSEHSMTKQQFAAVEDARRLQAERDELAQRVSLGEIGGSEVNLEELEKQLLQKVGTQVGTQIQGKEQEFKDLVMGVNKFTASAALTTPWLNAKHKDEFGEYFNPSEFVAEATKKNRFDLEEYYEKDFVVERRAKAVETKHKAEIERLQKESDDRYAKAQQESDERAQRLQGMGQNGPGLAEGGAPEMGAFERKYRGLTKPEDASNGVPEKAVLGDGTIAAVAARNAVEQAARRAS